MTISDDLFELIKALTKSEKRYFKLFSSLHKGEKIYLRLFDAIEKQTRTGKYDKKKLVDQFKKEGIKTQFWIFKNYLYRQILYALKSYHTSIHSDVRNLLHDTEILYEKGLYKQALKVMKKAKQIAFKNEMHWSLLEIYRYWELPLAMRSSDMDWAEHVIKEESRELSLMQNTKTYRDMNYRITVEYYHYGVIRNQKQLHTIEKIIKNPSFTESGAKTFEAKLRFYDSHLLVAFLKGDNSAMYLYAHKVIQHYKAHPEKITQNLIGYIRSLSTISDACGKTKRYNELSGYLQEMEALAPSIKSTLQKARLFSSIAANKIGWLNDTGEFKTALDYIGKIKMQVEEFSDNILIADKTFLFGNIANSHFGAGEYKKSIYWLNRIRNELSFSLHPDIESFLRLLYLLAHYEAGSHDLLTYLVQSVYRFLRKKKRLYKFETLAIGFLRKLPSARTPNQLRSEFKQFHSLLKPLTKDPYEKSVFEYFDFMSWLESKIENRAFAEIVRQKADPSYGG